MFESRYCLVPTDYAMASPAVDARYADCWDGLTDQSVL